MFGENIYLREIMRILLAQSLSALCYLKVTRSAQQIFGIFKITVIIIKVMPSGHHIPWFPHPNIQTIANELYSAILYKGLEHQWILVLIAQLVKNLPAMQETLVQSVGWEDPPEKGRATHSSILGLPWWLSR